MANAKRIHADLITLDYAKETETALKDQLETCSQVLISSQASETSLKVAAKKTDAQLAEEKRKRRKLRWEVWGWRILGLIALIEIAR